MTNTEREALWQERVDRWRASGLTKRAFALQEGYSIRQMSYWIRRLSTLSAKASPVSVMAQGGGAMVPALKLCGPQGWSIELPPGTPADWLADLLRSL